MDSVTLERVRQIAADLFNFPAEQIALDSSPDSIEAWDSLDHLNFVLALEQQFGLQFEPEEIGQMMSIELTAMLVAEKLNGRGH